MTSSSLYRVHGLYVLSDTEEKKLNLDFSLGHCSPFLQMNFMLKIDLSKTCLRDKSAGMSPGDLEMFWRRKYAKQGMLGSHWQSLPEGEDKVT